MSNVIQSLWIGPRLSTMERLSVLSFLDHGHEYHLYAYEDVAGIPRGSVVRDAREILPASAIFQYADYETYSGFSNFFRYKLLVERGGWWVDTDVVCLKPFAFDSDHVFASESFGGRQLVSSAVIKAPPGSQAIAYAWRVCESKKPAELQWGETGPRLVETAVDHFGLQRFVQPPEVFCPIDYGQWERFLDADNEIELDSSSSAVHLWHEMWRRAGRDKDADYDPGCLYERLKRSILAR